VGSNEEIDEGHIIDFGDISGHNEEKNILGEGEFGKVYLGYFKETKQVAIKTIKDDNSDRFQKIKEEIEHEASLMCGLEHTNVLRFIGIVKSDDCLYIVLEYCDSGTLDKIIKKKKKADDPLEVEELKDIFYQTSLGLAYLHKNKIVHGDFAPRNVLLHGGDKKSYKICDFGLSRKGRFNEKKILVTKPLSKAPEKSPIPIMPPEDIKNKGIFISEKSDVWAYGIFMFELISFKRGFYYLQKDESILDLIKKGELPCKEEDLKKYVPDDNMRALILDCWIIDIEDRITMTEVGNKIEVWDE